jgi:hypothetical protein
LLKRFLKIFTILILFLSQKMLFSGYIIKLSGARAGVAIRICDSMEPEPEQKAIFLAPRHCFGYNFGWRIRLKMKCMNIWFRCATVSGIGREAGAWCANSASHPTSTLSCTSGTSTEGTMFKTSLKHEHKRRIYTDHTPETKNVKTTPCVQKKDDIN